jgi:hypothetical protein
MRNPFNPVDEPYTSLGLLAATAVGGVARRPRSGRDPEEPKSFDRRQLDETLRKTTEDIEVARAQSDKLAIAASRISLVVSTSAGASLASAIQPSSQSLLLAMEPSGEGAGAEAAMVRDRPSSPESNLPSSGPWPCTSFGRGRVVRTLRGPSFLRTASGRLPYFADPCEGLR